MEFRVTVRDNSINSISCTAEDNIVVTTVAGGPFEVSTANVSGTIWFEGNTQTVNWVVAGTDVAPVSCANVDILMSYDGGLTYPITLASGVPNIGTADITVPPGTTTTARLMISCPDNIFYNVSASNFEIQSLSPTFTITLPVVASTICPNDIVSIPITTESVDGFNGNINLTVSNVPGASSASFGNQTIAAGSSTTLSINNTSSLAAGDYALMVSGTNGSIVRNATYILTVLEGVGTTNLSSPIDAATDMPLSLSLGWVLKSNATSYTVQLATSPSFTSTIVDQTVSANAYTIPTRLSPLTTYYWRVSAMTSCGVTAFSTVRSFTTGNCVNTVTNNTPVTIPAAGTPVVTSVITMTQPGNVTELSVSDIIGTHTYVTELKVELIGPGGAPIVELWSGLCGGSDDFNLSLSENAAIAVAEAPCSPVGQSGRFLPEDPLSAFIGSPIAGDWILRISDDAPNDGGELVTWSLDFCTTSSAPLPVEMLSFEASAGKSDIRLDWKTATEENNAGFDIERRAEYETAFASLSTVDAKVDAQVENDYGYTDADVRAGVRYYYRLRQNDLDGKFEYSDVRTAALVSKTRGLQVSPNPVRGDLFGTLDVEASTQTDLVLLDLNGRVVLAQAAVGPTFFMQLDKLPAGMYVLKAKHVGGEEIVKFVVE